MKSAEYWAKRFNILEQSQHDRGAAAFSEIDRKYRAAQRSIEGKIAAWYQRFADNNQITLQEAKQWLTDKELEEFKWDVHEYIRYGQDNAINGMWTKELENASARFHISRLEALKIQCQQDIESVFGGQVDALDQAMRDVYRTGYYHTAFEIQKGVGVGWDFSTLDTKTISKVINKPWAVDGVNFSDRIWADKQKLVSELDNTLTQNIILGQDPQKAIDTISKRLNVSKMSAGRLVMTEEAYFSSEAQKDCFAELDVEQYEIVATLDSITSEICREMDGKVFKMSEWEVGVTAPPFHPWCRTTTVPHFDDEFDVGERAARGADGKTYHVPANMKYKDWEKAFVDGDKSGIQAVQNVQPTQQVQKQQAPKVKTVDDCQTADEVQDMMKKQGWFYKTTLSNGNPFDGNDYVNLTGLDTNCAKSIYKTHEALFNKYPNLSGKLNSITNAKLGGMTYAQCSYGFGHGGVTVNSQYFSDEAKLIRSFKSDCDHGFHPAGVDYDSIVMHELGHAVDDYLTYTLQAAGFNGWKPKEVSAMLRPKVMKAAGFKVSDTYQQVSGYATKNACEWFAECFCEWMCSKDPRPVAKEFGKQLEELMKGCGIL